MIFWNVQGLRKKAAETAKYMSQFDIIALQETWIEKNHYGRTEKNLPAGYNWIWTEAVREKKKGRPAGGLVFGIRKELQYKEWEGNCKGCWASVEVEISGKWFSILMVYNNTNLDNMKTELSSYLQRNLNKRVIIGGDLNARIGTLGSTEYNEERPTKDTSINEEGRKWVNLLDTYGISILNGNMDGDTEGNITHPGLINHEEAVLDYGGANTMAHEEIEKFTVDEENDSDHFPITLTLKSDAKPKDGDWTTIQEWNPRTKKEYKERLISGSSSENWKGLHKKLWDATPKRKFKKSNCKNAVWWNTECY